MLHFTFTIIPYRGIYCWSDCVNTITPRHEIFSGIFRSYYLPTNACQYPSLAWSVGGRALRVSFWIFSSLGLRIWPVSINYLALSPHVLRAVMCDVCKTCLTSTVMLSTNDFIYFKEYKDDKQSLTYPPERLVEIASDSVTVGWYNG